MTVTHDSLSAEMLAAMDDAERAATPGPWEAGTASCCPDMGWIDGPAGKGRVCPTHESTKRTHTIDAQDAEFIVLLRNNARALLSNAASALDHERQMKLLIEYIRSRPADCRDGYVDASALADEIERKVWLTP